MDITMIVTLVGEVVVLIGTITPLLITIGKISNGTKCQLRNDMLNIYYKHQKSKKIRQYEYESFVLLYDAYKALKGNSFIDKIYKEVQTWEIISWES